MATETENMDVDFCKKYTAKLQEKVVLSASGAVSVVDRVQKKEIQWLWCD